MKAKNSNLTARTLSQKKTIILSLCAVLIFSIFIALRLGWTDVGFLTIFKSILGQLGFINSDISHTTQVILVNVRLPRVILDIVVGIALAVSGCVMQGLFRNPMASPYVTGIASAGAFGAALIILTGLSSFWIGPAAFIMALFTAFFVYHLAKDKNHLAIETLLLAGIALSLLFSALVSLTQYMSNEKQLREIVMWLMGRLWEADWQKVMFSLPIIFSGCGVIAFFHKELNLMLLGDKSAKSLGVDLEKIRKILLFLVSLITAIAVSVSGVIGFVGLIVPHIMRIIIGPDHKYLLPASALAGAIFLICTDTLARTILAPVELPVGIITALLGVPFFLFILKKKSKNLGFGS